MNLLGAWACGARNLYAPGRAASAGHRQFYFKWWKEEIEAQDR